MVQPGHEYPLPNGQLIRYYDTVVGPRGLYLERGAPGAAGELVRKLSLDEADELQQRHGPPELPLDNGGGGLPSDLSEAITAHELLENPWHLHDQEP